MGGLKNEFHLFPYKNEETIHEQFGQFKCIWFSGLVVHFGNNQEIQKVMGIFPIRGTFSFQYGNFTVYMDHLNRNLQSTQGY